ncbi:unnamed protein product [Gordionus sp. m RMFG-2023]|uniref:large ribosomal subunit protein uL30m-like n=1 Tax=Gordionus sp. m RMFG-2023 TaxID=3053472 RepID=UPI0030DDEB5F
MLNKFTKTAHVIRNITKTAALFKKPNASIYRPQIPQNILDNAGHELSPGVMPFKLMLVYKVKPPYYLPHYELKALKEVGLDKNIKYSQRVVMKNTSDICKKLWQVKHLIRIIPLRFPNGIPVSDSDVMNTRINLETGEVSVIHEIKPTKSIEGSHDVLAPVPDEFKDVYMSGEDCRRYNRHVWI